LPWEWRQAVNGDRWEDETNGARYPTRREAEDAAALAWGTLPADVRAKILGAGA
jgi:septal ring-binding cell division protein DamX